MRLTVFAGVLLATMAAPLAAQAQGVPGGAAHGFNEGGRIAGPVGAVVGTAVGGGVGGGAGGGRAGIQGGRPHRGPRRRRGGHGGGRRDRRRRGRARHPAAARRLCVWRGRAAAGLPAPQGAPPLRHHAPRAASRAPDESWCAAAAGLRAIASSISISVTNGGPRSAVFFFLKLTFSSSSVSPSSS